MSASVPLSTDLVAFLEERHQQLAAELAGKGAAIEAAAAEGDATIGKAMGQALGLYAYLLPAGGVVDVRALCLVREMLGYVSPLADAIFAVQGLGSYPIALAGSEQHKALLDGFRRGALIGGFALTEPDAGSDVASMQTTARADGDDFVLDGEKTLISNVGIASHYVVFANADPAAGRRGITAFLVGKEQEGLEELPFEVNVDHPIGGLRFSSCRVSKQCLLGDVGGGFKLAMQTLDTFRVTVGAAAVGMARRALDLAADHVRGRVQFGVPLAEQQIVQSYLADMSTELDAARLLVLRAAHSKDRALAGEDIDRVTLSTEAAKAKLYATEAAQTIIDKAVQLHGGRGVRTGQVVENLYRAIRPLRIYEGTSEIQRLIIGRAIAGGAR